MRLPGNASPPALTRPNRKSAPQIPPSRIDFALLPVTPPASPEGTPQTFLSTPAPAQPGVRERCHTTPPTTSQSDTETHKAPACQESPSRVPVCFAAAPICAAENR